MKRALPRVLPGPAGNPGHGGQDEPQILGHDLRPKALPVVSDHAQRAHFGQARARPRKGCARGLAQTKSRGGACKRPPRLPTMARRAHERVSSNLVEHRPETPVRRVAQSPSTSFADNARPDLAKDISTLSTNVGDRGHTRYAALAEAPVRPLTHPFARRAQGPYHAARLMRACDHENTHGMGGRRFVQSDWAPKAALGRTAADGAAGPLPAKGRDVGEPRRRSRRYCSKIQIALVGRLRSNAGGHNGEVVTGGGGEGGGGESSVLTPLDRRRRVHERGRRDAFR